MLFAVRFKAYRQYIRDSNITKKIGILQLFIVYFAFNITSFCYINNIKTVGVGLHQKVP